MMSQQEDTSSSYLDSLLTNSNSGGGGGNNKTGLTIGIVVAVIVFILVAIGIGVAIFFYLKRKEGEPKDVSFEKYEKWSKVSSSGSPGDAGTPPTVPYGSLSLYIKGDNLKNGNWSAATSSSKDQQIQNTSPGTYKNTSTSTVYSFTLNVNLTSGYINIPSDETIDPTTETAQYLLGYTTYKDGTAPPANGRPNYGANAIEYPVENISTRDVNLPFTNINGSFKDVLLYPGQVLNVGLNILISPKTGTSEPRILKKVVFNIDSGSITKQT